MTMESSPIDEDQLRKLLKGGERPIPLSNEQRDRLRRQIGPGLEVNPRDRGIDVRLTDAGSATESAEPLEAVFRERAAEPRGRRLLAAAAIAIFTALLGWGIIASQGGEVLETATNPELTQPRAAVACPAEVSAFLEAIDLWGSVENWSFLTDRRAPEPDLLRLALEAVESPALAQAVEDGSVAEQLRKLQQASLDGPELPWTDVDREEHFDAVTSAEVVVSNATIDSPALVSCSVEAEPS